MPLTTEQAAASIGVKASTLNAWRCRREGPPWRYAGRLVIYDEADVERWKDEQKTRQIKRKPPGSEGLVRRQEWELVVADQAARNRPERGYRLLGHKTKRGGRVSRPGVESEGA